LLVKQEIYRFNEERSMSDEMINPSGPWDPDRDEFTLDQEQSGCSNLSSWRGAIDTENQRLSSLLHMTGYKLRSQAKKHEFYSLFGSFSHGVSHNNSSYHPVKNWVSVGYYATEMLLTIEVKEQTSIVWDSGPTSTVRSSQTGFNIGGNLSAGSFGGEPILQAGVSGSFGASFSSPDVVFAHSMFEHHVQWLVKLPGVGYISPAVPANPEEPSYAGYEWRFGAIFVVPFGQPFSVDVKAQVFWEFDYTRGIKYDTKTSNQKGTYSVSQSSEVQ
jgi:hypothetical protein